MPPPPDPRIQQVMALLKQQQLDDARRLCAQVIAERPSDGQARFASALVDRVSGDLPRAIETLEKLHAANPGHPAIRAELASTRVMAGRVAEAIPILTEIVARQPAQPFGHFWLGQAMLRSFRGAEAVRCFERVRELNPADQDILQPLASAHLAAGRARGAEAACRELLLARPDHVPSMVTLTAALEQQGRLEEAGEISRRVLEIDPANASALAGVARVLQAEGRRDEARELLEPHLAGAAQPTLVSTYAGLCSTPAQRRTCIDAATPLIDEPAVSTQDRAGLCFAIARLLDAESEHDRAFEFYLRGNELYPKAYDPSDKHLYTSHIIETFSKDRVASMPRAAASSGRPIFILGMPRSGTTLVEQILAAHPDVHPAGELQELRHIWRELVGKHGPQVTGLAGLTQSEIDAAAERYLAHLDTFDTEAPRITDKMPHNFEQLGLINLLFPDARVIHCRRSPLDTCVSCYTIQFSLAHAYANDLAHLGHAYGEYRRLMAHWQAALDIAMTDVIYEELVADIEPHARRIVEFAGLPWNDDCLRFYEADRSVKTASVDQVRKPIYSSSVARWKRYEQHLTPLIHALRAAGIDPETP